jgi:hypothetical protein
MLRGAPSVVGMVAAMPAQFLEADRGASPLLALLVTAYWRLAFVLVVAGVVAGVAVKVFYTPGILDIAVSLVTGGPTGVISYVRVRRQLRTAGPPPAGSAMEAPSAMSRRFAIRIAWLTLALAALFVGLPLLLGASHDFVGNAAAFGAGVLLSNGYACFVLGSATASWEDKNHRRIIHEVRARVISKPIRIYLEDSGPTPALDTPPASSAFRVVADEGSTSVGDAANGNRIGALIGVYAGVGAYVIGIALMVAATATTALIVFIVAVVALIPVNIAACTWIDRHPGAWTGGVGSARIEARIRTVREDRILRHSAAWATRASVGWFTLAAILLNAVTAVVLGRVLGGQPVGPRKVHAASIGYSMCFAAVYCAVGFAVGDIL